METNNLNIIAKSSCPYCKFVLDKKPIRNKKCPNCKQRIMVRDKVLMTERQADEYYEAKIQKLRKQLEDSARNSLVNLKKSGVIEFIEILAAEENSCEACKALDGKKIKIEDAINSPPLPVKACTGILGYCRCTYIPVVE